MGGQSADLRAVPEPSAIPDVYILARRGEQILLLLRDGTGYKDHQWGPPSGKVEPGETYAEAAARELKEETGVTVAPHAMALCHAIERIPDRGARWLGMFFEVEIPAQAEPQNRERDKHSRVAFFRQDALPRDTVDYVAHSIAAAKRGLTYSAWRYDPAEDEGI